MKLLLVAPTVDGTDVGEAWVAFQWVKRLAARHDVTLLTYNKRGRPPVSQQLSGLRIVEWNELPMVGRAERINSMLKPSFIPFYVHARRWIRKSLDTGMRYDVGHQLTPSAMRYPSPLAGLGVPWVIGPVGGGLKDPPGFGEDGDTAPWYVGLRDLDSWRLSHDRILRRTYEQADCVAVIAPYVVDNLRGLNVKRFEVMGDVALDVLPPLSPRSSRHGEPLRLLFVGRVIRTKGVRDLVRAMSLVPELDVLLDVVGDGFDRAECMRLTAELALSDRITFHGKLPRERVDAFYANADVFVFPSYREPGGSVVLEAMGHALPCIVCSRGGPGTSTDDSCAIRITPENPQQLATEVAAGIRTFAESPELLRSMGDAARQRVASTALWDRRIEQAETIYSSLS